VNDRGDFVGCVVGEAPFPSGPCAWVANLDAEDELARGTAYRPPNRETRAAFAARLRAAGLPRPGDVVLDAGEDERRARGLPGVAFMPTPWALQRLRAAGAIPPRDAPPLDVLRAANTRGLLPSLLPGWTVARGLDAARAALGRPSPTGRWLCKRLLGSAGRGHRVIDCGRPTALDEAWIETSVRRTGGIDVSPLVERTADFARHGTISALSSDESTPVCVHLAPPTAQHVDVHRHWRGSRPVATGELRPDEARALEAAALEAAAALAAIGYRGPFGIDAFRYRLDGAEHFCARIEVNARLSMGRPASCGGANSPASVNRAPI
jgi:hypothetical protein